MNKRILIILFILVVSVSYGQSIDDRINEIRKEVAVINNCKTFKIDTANFFDESSEGAERRIFRDSSGQIRKIFVAIFGETGRWFGEYYFKNNQSFFAFTKNERYNLPFYMDKKIADEEGYKEWFDPAKSKIFENRFYFDDSENLIQVIDSDKNVIIDEEILRALQDHILKDIERYKNKVDERE
jgi:hypothetical protein